MENIIDENYNFVDKTLTKIMYQIIIVSYILCIGMLLKQNNYILFEKIYNSSSWIINEDISPNKMYCLCIERINNKFDLNIPINNNKEDLNEKTIEQDIENKNIENNHDSIQKIEIENTKEILGFDCMKEYANEINAKYIFLTPTEGVVTSPFGNRSSSNKNVSSFHLGVDIANEVGTNINAAMPGKVELVAYNEVYGNYIKIINEDIITIYAHCSKILVQQGDSVVRGTLIAKMGQSGNATGPHLHFEVRKNGYVINPEYLIEI